MLAGFEAIDQGRRVLAGGTVTPRRPVERRMTWSGAALVEVHGVRQEVAYFTSFYVHSLTRGMPDALRARTWPRITRLDDRWRWLVMSVVPRFRQT